MNIRDITETLDQRIFSFKNDLPVGLAQGKVGYCIYCYYISRLSGISAYNLYAEQLIDDILAGISNVKCYDMEQGLLGIGLGIDYLIENDYIKGDCNEVLKGIDNTLFKQICYPYEYYNMQLSIQLQFLYYFITRLKKQNAGSENETLFREIIIHAINITNEN